MRLLKYIFFLIASVLPSYSQDIPVYIALKQNNIDLLENLLHDISNPFSTNYGNYLSNYDIHTIVDPPLIEQYAVIDWLNDNDISCYINYGDAIKLSGPKDVLQNMFDISKEQTKTHDLVEYTIPEHLTHIIDFVEMSITDKNLKHHSSYMPLSKPVSYGNTDDRFFGREPLMNMYNVSNKTLSQSVIGVLAEFQSNGGFLPADLFIQQASNNQTENDVTKIIGGNIGIDVESVLDVQMMSQAGNGMELWFWDTPYWMYAFTVDFFNSQNIGNIVSMSWGWAEDSQCDIIDCSGDLTSKKYVERVNNEFLKIALRGVTIVVSSGDAGAPGRTNEECGYDRPMNPTFPGSSPYITSVGATYVNYKNATTNFSTTLCRDFGCIVSTDERSISYEQVGWTAGGGFELYSKKTPWWQAEAVEEYFLSGVTLPAISLYNGNGRAYPDLSAIGHTCPIYLEDEMRGVDGTSCSAPIVGGLLGIISDHLWTRHHIRLGFVNPLLYFIHENCEDCFRDITVGHNWCTEQQCCDNATNFGFTATKGYDPVSGLGTMNIGKILEFIDEVF